MAGNPWLIFLKSYRAKHKDKSMKTAMKDAAVEYRKSKGTAKTTKKKGKGKKKKSK